MATMKKPPVKTPVKTEEPAVIALTAFPVPTFSFSLALELLNRGFIMQRRGWNGKNMYVYRVPVSVVPCDILGVDLPGSTSTSTLVAVNVLPYLMMRTVDGSHVPWLISHTDATAEDWVIHTLPKSLSSGETC